MPGTLLGEQMGRAGNFPRKESPEKHRSAPEP